MSAGSKPLRPWQVCAGDVIGSGKRVEYVFERYGELYINASDERWAEALDSGCAIAIEKFIADWNGRADANRWKHAAQPDDNIWDNELK